MATPSDGCLILIYSFDVSCSDVAGALPSSDQAKLLLMARMTQHSKHKLIVDFIFHSVLIHVHNPLDNPYLLSHHLMERSHRLNHLHVHKQAVLDLH